MIQLSVKSQVSSGTKNIKNWLKLQIIAIIFLLPEHLNYIFFPYLSYLISHDEAPTTPLIVKSIYQNSNTTNRTLFRSATGVVAAPFFSLQNKKLWRCLYDSINLLDMIWWLTLMSESVCFLCHCQSFRYSHKFNVITDPVEI